MSEVTSGIGELLQRLRKDGVEAGEAEKQRILREVETKAAAQLAAAETRAAQIVAAAEAEVEAKRKQFDAELRLAARDFTLRFTERIKRQVIEPLIDRHVAEALDSAGLLETLLVELVRNEATGGRLTVSPETRSALESRLKGELAQMVESGAVRIQSEDGLSGFRLQRDGDAFTWDVTAETVARELSALVEPSLRDYFQPSSKR